TACTSFVFTARSTPLTILVPSSRATCRFFSSSSANFVTSPYVEGSGLKQPLVASSYPSPARLRPSRLSPAEPSKPLPCGYAEYRDRGDHSPPVVGSSALRREAAARDRSVDGPRYA